MGTPDMSAAVPTDTETKEAMEYWGYLFKPDKCGTEMLNRLLRGIAIHVSTKLDPSACQDLLPTQLATFYRAVGGNYDILFVETPSTSLSFIYKSLGCLHSLQPGEGDDGYCSPSIPALKHKGFITWQTIQLLLGPEEQVPFLQNALKSMDIVNPDTGDKFPKILPKEAFPEKPDQAMVQWYNEVSARLTADAQAAQEASIAAREERGARPPGIEHVVHSSSDDEQDERSQAAKYFSNPFYRDGDGRPRIVRRQSKQRPFSPRITKDGGYSLYDRGKGLVHGVRHFISPSSYEEPKRRRRSYPERREQASPMGGPPDGGGDDDDGTNTSATLHPGYVPRATKERRAAAAQRRQDMRQDTPSSGYSSRSESPGSSRPPSSSLHPPPPHPPPHPPPAATSVPPPAPRPPLQNRDSDDPSAAARRDYFPPQYPHDGRRHSAHSPLYPGTPCSSSGGFGPSESPLFATQVGQMRGGGGDARRAAASPSRPHFADARSNGRDARERERERDHERYERRQERPAGAMRQRSSDYSNRRHDFPDAYRVQSDRDRDRERERDRRDRERVRFERDRRRSHSSGYEGGRERERERNRERERDRPRMARHITPVDGVGGRKYVSPVWGNRQDRPPPPPDRAERVRDGP